MIIKEYKPIDTVIHLAGLKSVAESLINPLHYWDVNTLGTLNLLLTMKEYECTPVSLVAVPLFMV